MCRVTPPGYVQEYGETRAMRIDGMYCEAKGAGYCSLHYALTPEWRTGTSSSTRS